MSSTRIEIPFTVETEDGKKHESVIRLPDMARTEGKLGVSLADFGDDSNPSFEFMLTAAYFALRRKGDAPDNFDLWFDSIVDLDHETPEEDAPGEAAAPSEEEALSTPSQR